MSATTAYPLFSVYGIELEYMIVDDSGHVLPLADSLFHQLTSQYADEYIEEDISWNNELVRHVLELKTTNPVPTLDELDKNFHSHILKANCLLSQYNGSLLSTGAHPWMDPEKHVELWPHGNRQIYEMYDKIFNCRGHGWANLQSAHINLPFQNEKEFIALHNAIRLVLPLIPALTASTPIIEGAVTGYQSTRLWYYGKNQCRIPSISGDIIPEPITSIAAYHDTILRPMFEAISPYDPEKLLQEEWLNSRAAIARFDRNAIEIRIMDTQESPLMDIACIAAITALIKQLIIEEKEATNIPQNLLKNLYENSIRQGFATEVEHKAYLACFGLENACNMRTLWDKQLTKLANSIAPRYQTALSTLLTNGNVAERILTAMRHKHPLTHIYQQIGDCLEKNSFFEIK